MMRQEVVQKIPFRKTCDGGLPLVGSRAAEQGSWQLFEPPPSPHYASEDVGLF
jgi:hypothetical protein